MKKSMDLKTLWDRASKKSKVASTSTPKPAPIIVESRSRNQGNPSPSDGLQVVPDDDKSGDDESIASNAKQLQAEAEALYLSHLTTSVHCLRFILQQGLPVHGHLENEGNAGNFLELVDWLAENIEGVKRVDLKDAPRSSELLDQKAQEQVINACAKETTRLIIEDLGDGYFSVLVYESRDVEQQEQLAICLRYVGTKGMAVERLLGIVGVEDTTPLTIKTTIQNLLTSHSLSFSRVRGLGYDAACAMKGYDNRLKKLIVDEAPSAYYVHCFAHQLQIRMLGVAQAEYIIETFELEETEAEYGLDRESLGTPCDTPRGSRYENVMHVISLYPAIWEILCMIGDEHSGIKSLRAQQVSYAFETFEFVFIAHLLQTIFEYTDDLCSALQKRDQDIVNAIDLVSVTKKRLQLLQEDGEWERFLQKVTSFCVKHDIELVDMHGLYDPVGRSPKFYEKATNLHYYHVDMFLDVIGSQLRELDGMFDEVNTELLICMAAFNPVNSFAAYDEEKLVKLANFYPEDFSQCELLHLPFQLSNFVDDLRLDERFREVKTLAELSIKLVETRKDRVYNIVYRLLRLALILPVGTASDERDLSSVNYVNNKAENKLSEQCANDCLVTCLERETFGQVKDDAIISRFRAVNNR
ncbi:zinc finger MYM-type protein 1-like isoform X2 [Hordeum vulgare subsp. vulgare]|uniref:zinc finger MYM-type protein 1-like isoform X2 n=1 Tax=Hordeum vulgare subsp. vulgare TaxID=112509 RepID=UPI001D1A3B8E|nr:zinc finger MYM-type protein 1-like isoform X2 [Hordeum vulgare subsp. vulgare]